MGGAGITVMGGAGLVDADGVPHPVRGSRKRALLAALVLHRDRPVAPSVLADAVWGEAVPATAASALRVHLSELRKAMAAFDGDLEDAITTSDGGYRLTLTPDRLDVGAFEQLVDRAAALPDSPEALDDLAEALARWRGRPYDELADHGPAIDEAARLERRRGEAAARLARLSRSLRATEMIPALERQLQHGPHDESVAAALIDLLHLVGRRDEALATARATRDRLQVDLDVEPGTDLLDAEEQARRGDAPIALAAWTRPVRATPLLGRDHELESLAELVRQPGVVTVVGPPGVGKTRLAEAAAVAATEQTGRPVLWLDAATLAPGADVPGLAARTLDLADQPFRSTATVVTDHLAASRPVVVIDNAEHVATSTGELLDAIVPVVDAVLVTSRAPLDRADERIVRLTGLRDTEAGADLLIECVHRAGGPVRPDRDRARALSDELDGLPLALELAGRAIAAHGHDIDAPLVLRRLGAGGGHDGPLASAVTAGLDALDEADVDLFERCGVFAGWFTVADASSLVDHDVESAIVRLAEHSLLATGSGPRGLRFRLLVPVREIARMRLASTPEREAETRRRHALHIAAAARQAGRSVNEAGSSEARARLGELGAELALALDWLEEGHDPDAHVGVVAGLWLHWYLSGQLRLGRRRTQAALRRPGGTPADRGDALAAAAFLAWIQADYGTVRRWVLEAKELDASGAALPVRHLADTTLAWIEHDLDAAEEHLTAAMGVLAERGAATSLPAAFVGSMWANVAWFRGDHHEAARRYDTAALAAERIGHGPPAELNRRHEVLCLALAGSPTAAARVEQLAASLDDETDPVARCQGATLAGLALVELGERERATSLLRDGVTGAARVVDAISLVLGTIGLVRLAVDRDDPEAVAAGLGWLDVALGLTPIPLPRAEQHHLAATEEWLAARADESLPHRRVEGRTLPADHLGAALTGG